MAKCGRKILVCTKGKKCRRKGSGELFQRFVELAEEVGSEIEIVGCKCLGMCKSGPSVVEMPGKSKHKKVSHDDVPRILTNPCPENKSKDKKKTKKKKKKNKTKKHD